MDAEDQKDIIRKVKTSGAGDEDVEDEVDVEEPADDTEGGFGDEELPAEEPSGEEDFGDAELEEGLYELNEGNPCWDGYEKVPGKNDYEEGSCKKKTDESETITEAEYQGKSVELNKPSRGDVKKFKVYVKNDKGNVVKVNFGDKNMEIKRDDPERRKSFRARHNCDNPGPKWKARYWSCKMWSKKSVSDIVGENLNTKSENGIFAENKDMKDTIKDRLDEMTQPAPVKPDVKPDVAPAPEEGGGEELDFGDEGLEEVTNFSKDANDRFADSSFNKAYDEMEQSERDEFDAWYQGVSDMYSDPDEDDVMADLEAGVYEGDSRWGNDPHFEKDDQWESTNPYDELNRERQQAYREDPEIAAIADFLTQFRRKLEILHKQYMQDTGDKVPFIEFVQYVYHGHQDLVFDPRMNEGLNISEKFRIFADKKNILNKLREHHDMTYTNYGKYDRDEYMVEPMTKPQPTKTPTVVPEEKPSRRSKPFRPNRKANPDPKGESNIIDEMGDNKEELMIPVERWYENTGPRLLTVVYWWQRQIPPTDLGQRIDAIQNVGRQLNDMYPAPEGTIERMTKEVENEYSE